MARFTQPRILVALRSKDRLELSRASLRHEHVDIARHARADSQGPHSVKGRILEQDAWDVTLCGSLEKLVQAVIEQCAPCNGGDVLFAQTVSRREQYIATVARGALLD